MANVHSQATTGYRWPSWGAFRDRPHRHVPASISSHWLRTAPAYFPAIGYGQYYSYTDDIPVTWDRWFPVVMDLKIRLASDGYLRVEIDGTQYLNYSGLSRKAPSLAIGNQLLSRRCSPRVRLRFAVRPGKALPPVMVTRSLFQGAIQRDGKSTTSKPATRTGMCDIDEVATARGVGSHHPPEPDLVGWG